MILQRTGTIEKSVKTKIFEILPAKYRMAYERLPEEMREGICEIRIRAGALCSFTSKNVNIPMETEYGMVFSDETEIEKIVSDMTGGSLYSYSEQIKHGYITFSSARVGIAGVAVTENGNVETIRRMTSLNIRIPRNVPGAADEAVKYICENGIESSMGILAVSPPNCGKTTFLRSLGAALSTGIYEMGEKKAYRVCIADERDEIYLPGVFKTSMCDVYSGFPKAVAVENAARTLSPQVIILDEIGNRREAMALGEAYVNGVYIAASFHGKDVRDIKSKPYISRLVKDGVFRTACILSHTSQGFSCRIEKL